MLLILPVLAALSALAVFYVLGRPRYLSGGKVSQKLKNKISIIIPARDEASNIPELLASLESELEWFHEVIVVDDSSEDGTGDLARSAGAKVITSQALPSNWNGKPWACHQGAASATGDWLLFIDADVRFSPDAGAYIHQLTSSKSEHKAYSIYPHHTVTSAYEQLSAYFNSLMVAGINAFGFKSASGHDSALFGQALLISKLLLQQSGGHAAVKDKVLENFYLAEILKTKNAECQCLLGKGLVSMRMFPDGFSELWSSWKKGFVSGAANVDAKALLFSSLWISAGMLSIVSLALLGFPKAPDSYGAFVAAAYLINAFSCWWAFRIAGSFSSLCALLFPLTLLFYQTLFFTALIDKWRGKKTNWKGRMVQ